MPGRSTSGVDPTADSGRSGRAVTIGAGVSRGASVGTGVGAGVIGAGTVVDVREVGVGIGVGCGVAGGAGASVGTGGSGTNVGTGVRGGAAWAAAAPLDTGGTTGARVGGGLPTGGALGIGDPAGNAPDAGDADGDALGDADGRTDGELLGDGEGLGVAARGVDSCGAGVCGVPAMRGPGGGVTVTGCASRAASPGSLRCTTSIAALRVELTVRSASSAGALTEAGACSTTCLRTAS